jgi:uncharacterized protein
VRRNTWSVVIGAVAFVGVGWPGYSFAARILLLDPNLAEALITFRFDEVKRLVRAGADPDLRLENRHTPMSMACQLGDLDFVRELQERGAPLDGQDRLMGWTPLHYAAATGNVVLAEFLLERGIDPDSRSARRETPLYVAAEAGQERMVRRLLELGVDVNARDRVERTPLMRACLSGQEGVVRLLLERGARIDARDRLGSTPLMFCRREELIRLLVRRGARVNVRNQRGDMPILRAARTANPPVLRLLVRAGADLRARDPEGHTPLQLAGMDYSEQGTEALKTLLELGAVE